MARAPGEIPNVVTTTGDARLSAPSALRNRAALTQELARLAPVQGRALEIASGTGEHIQHFAAATPDLSWQPSDIDAARRASIDAWCAQAKLPNVATAIALDAAQPGWAGSMEPVDLVVLINLLHLIPDAAAQNVLRGIAEVLAPGGVALIYGPFLRDGETTSPGDAEFHQTLRAQDPLIGYKDIVDVVATLVRAGLHHGETRRMPANNLLIALRK